mgnify:CR=1 FL=1
MELNIMDKTKCITFDPVAQEALPDHIKAKMKADRDKAKLEAYHKQCLARTVTTIVAMMIIALVIEIVSI